MLRVIRVASKGDWPSVSAIDRICLEYEDRHRRRAVLTGENGTTVLIDFQRPVLLHDKDGLILEDGTMIEVIAAAEHLVEVRCKDALHLTRVAWHLGNRHVPAQISAGVLLIRRDSVIEALLCKLGAQLSYIDNAFDPEGGAYDIIKPDASKSYHESNHAHFSEGISPEADNSKHHLDRSGDGL